MLAMTCIQLSRLSSVLSASHELCCSAVLPYQLPPKSLCSVLTQRVLINPSMPGSLNLSTILVILSDLSYLVSV